MAWADLGVLNWCLELPGMALGLTGAVLVAGQRAQTRITGFAVWVVSNICLVAFNLIEGNLFLATMFMVYNVTCALGLRNNIRSLRSAGDGA